MASFKTIKQIKHGDSFYFADSPSLLAARVSNVREHMKPRYCFGIGSAPLHVIDFKKQGKRGCIVVRDESGADSILEFKSCAGLQSCIETLVAQRVPFSIGGMCPGPADTLHYWFQERGVSPEYLEISWRGPDDWVIREIVEGATDEWQEGALDALLSHN